MCHPDVQTVFIILNACIEPPAFTWGKWIALVVTNTNLRRITCMTEYRKIIGPPGTGKTTKLIEIVKELTRYSLVVPRDILCISFTNKAVDEIMERTGLNRHIAPWFRTIHSTAFELVSKQSERYAGFSPGQIADKRLKEFELYDRAKYEEYNINLHRDLVDESSFAKSFRLWQDENDLLSFTNLLLEVLARSLMPPNIQYVIVDEAQDMTRLQAELVRLWASEAKTCWIIGDPDQSIYGFAGVDGDVFHEFDGETEVLKQSHRVPEAVHSVAERVINQSKRSINFDYYPKEEIGEVSYKWSLDSVYQAWDARTGAVAVLARTNRQVDRYADDLFQYGIPVVRRYGDDRESDPRRSVAWRVLRGFRSMLVGGEISGKHLLYLKEHLKRDALRHNANAKVWEDIDHEKKYDTDSVFRFLLSESLLEQEEDFSFDFVKCNKKTQVFKNIQALVARWGLSLFDLPVVTVSTIHGFKGGEADHVFLDVTMPKKISDLNEEIRIFYVGVTRAKQSLSIRGQNRRISF
jgi:superfamily I DNA/RNA helicase